METLIKVDSKKVKSIRNSYERIISLEGEQLDKKIQQFQIKGANAINDLLNGNDVDGKNSTLVIGSLVDLQVRDYAVGITNSSNRNKLIELWEGLAKSAPVGTIAPLATLASITRYEIGDNLGANEWLDIADKDQAGYALAQLIRRVMSAGWSADQFEVMRTQLHPKVVKTIYGASK